MSVSQSDIDKAENIRRQSQSGIAADCAKRFANDATWRRIFNCQTSNPTDPRYINALDNYIAVETKCRADEAKPAQPADPAR